jgi:lipopolysaccharide/colanic/teichoic acid biosynthesis glycosyltransferase
MRLIDIFLSLFALLIFSPVLLACILILRCTGEGEIFYTQIRIGKNNLPFKLYKFATMLKNSPNIGTGTITIENDPRVLPFGHFLRKSKINELPQLINIVLGDMSIIGPRPLTPENYNMYSEHVKDKLAKVRPGLSGVGSIIFRDEERFLTTQANASEIYRDIITPFKGKLEIWFVTNKSLKLYFLLICLTILVVFFSWSVQTLENFSFSS